MKKIVTLFVAIAAFCGFTSKAEEATTFEVNRIKYTVTGENSVGVSGLNENYEPGEVKLTEVIIPSFKSQASAISARVCPLPSAISFNARILPSTSSLSLDSCRNLPSVLTRLSSGIPFR